jgi:hypothetical protein
VRQGKTFLLYPTANNRPLSEQSAMPASGLVHSGQKPVSAISVESVASQKFLDSTSRAPP